MAQLLCPQSIVFSFGTRKAIVSRYEIHYALVGRPCGWDVSGSNDGVNWTVLHQKACNAPVFEESPYVSEVSRKEAFNKIRLTITSTYAKDRVGITEIRYYGYIED